MEPTEHFFGDDKMEVWVGVPRMCRVKRWKPIQISRLGKIDSLSDKTAPQAKRVALHLWTAFWVSWPCSEVSHTIEQQRKWKKKPGRQSQKQEEKAEEMQQLS